MWKALDRKCIGSVVIEVTKALHKDNTQFARLSNKFRGGFQTESGV